MIMSRMSYAADNDEIESKSNWNDRHNKRWVLYHLLQKKRWTYEHLTCSSSETILLLLLPSGDVAFFSSSIFKGTPPHLTIEEFCWSPWAMILGLSLLQFADNDPGKQHFEATVEECFLSPRPEVLEFTLSEIAVIGPGGPDSVMENDE